MRIALIVAVAENGVIGRGGMLPWRIPEDMRWFKSKTVGKPCIMGRKTWESFPKRPLPDRPNIVISRQEDYPAEGATVVHTLDEALVAAQRLKRDAEEIMVLGGAEIFAQALPFAGRIYLTRIHADVEGDTFLPHLGAGWQELWSQDGQERAKEGYSYTFTILERSPAKSL